MNLFNSILDPQRLIESKSWRMAEEYLQVTDNPYAINGINGKKITLIKTSTPSPIPLKILKCLSFATIIAPLIALLIRQVYRHKYQFQINPQFQTNALPLPIQEDGIESKKFTQPISPDPKTTPKDFNDLLAKFVPKLNSREIEAKLNNRPLVETGGFSNSRKPLIETGGFRNIGNTCYINSVVQCLKNVLGLGKLLSLDENPLSPRRGMETNLLIIEIRLELVEIFKKSFSGECVDDAEMEKLQNLLIRLEPHLIKGRMDDATTTWKLLAKVLGPSLVLSKYDTDEEEKLGDFYSQTFLQVDQKDWVLTINNTRLVYFPYRLGIRFGPKNPDANLDQDFRTECTLKERFEFDTGKKVIPYELVAVVFHPSYHFLSYVKDRVSGKWVCFNDSNVHEEQEIPLKLKGGAFFGIYERKEVILKSWIVGSGAELGKNL